MPIPSDITAPAVRGTRVVLDGTAPTPQGEALQVEPNYPFFWAVFPLEPTTWDAVVIEAQAPGDPYAGTWWLPKMTPFPVQPGVCGHRTKKKGQPASRSYSAAHTRVEENGGVIIPHERDYCIGVDCIGPRTKREGTYYMDPWSSPRAKIPNRRQKFNFDRDRFNRWRLQLLLDGVVPPPSRDVVDYRVAKVAERLDRRIAQDFKGDDAHKASMVGAASEAVEVASEATVAQPKQVRNAPPKRDASDPEQMTYPELKAAAAELGWPVNGVKKAELLGIVLEGQPFPGEEDPA